MNVVIQKKERIIRNPAFRLVLKGLLSHTVKEISVKDASQNKERILFIDCRDRYEYHVSRIEGAMHLDIDDFHSDVLQHIDKDQKIVVYGSVGYRSEKFSEILELSGFTDVSNLYGGLFEWINQSNKVYDSKGETNNVHGYNRTWAGWLTKGTKVYG